MKGKNLHMNILIHIQQYNHTIVELTLIKKYMTSDLNISKMYDQYVSVCLAQNKIAVEKHMF